MDTAVKRSARLRFESGAWVLTITQGTTAKRYGLEELSPHPEVGSPAYRLTPESSSSEPYDVILTATGWECGCADWNYRHRNDGEFCKHVAALFAVGLLKGTK